MNPVGIVTGLILEARCLAEAGHLRVACVGPGLASARLSAMALWREGNVSGLMSFGLAGGLDPALPPGTVIVAERVGDRPTTVWWRESLCRQLEPLGPRVGSLAVTDTVVASVAAKETLFAACGAMAVDMESAAVAEIAAEAGLAFAAVRVIADPAARGLPSVALAGMGADGRVRPLAVMAELVRHPGQVLGLIRVARDSGVATAVLRRVAVLIR